MTTDPEKPDKSLDEELVLMLRYLRLGRLLRIGRSTWRPRAKGVTRPSGC